MKTILVLGNARSGTSLTAGLLFYLGVDIKHVHKPDSQNLNGAFESVDFNLVTNKMQMDLNEGKSKDEILKLHNEELKEFIEKNESECWGLKSAATHWNLDIILPYFKNPQLIIVTRNIVDNAKSWVIHMADNYGQNISFDYALEKMLKSTESLINNVKSANCQKHWTTYESIKLNPLQESKKICDFLNLELDEEKQKKINEFVVPGHSTLNN